MSAPFVPSQLEEVLQKIEDAVTKIAEILASLPGRINSALDHFYIPDWVKELAVAAGNEMVSLIESARDKIVDTLTFARAPFTLYGQSGVWNDVKGVASNVAATAAPTAMPASRYWQGKSQLNYTQSTTGQSAAANAMASTADSASGALMKLAVAGMGCYATIAAGVVSYVVEQTAEAGAAATGVGAPPAAAATGVSVAKVIGIIVGALAVAGAIAKAMIDGVTTLHSELANGAAMPNGAWPDPIATSFSDGTVSDGTATWSVS